MNEPKVKVVKHVERRAVIHDDLRRLVISMKTVLKRRYPNPFERRMVEVKIMRELNEEQATG